jgi:NAD(P)-dependent dehydrogenase (short-subunit alcohol dehydrogenase family)
MIDRPLEGKVAFVTGAGRPRGIGRATAVEMAKRGAAVVVTDLARPGPRIEGIPTVAEDESGLHEAVAEIESFGGQGLAIALDVTEESEVQSAVATTVDEFGGIDVLFNNAGTPVGVKPFLDLSSDDWMHSWRVHVMGCVAMCRAVIPIMKERGGGVIVNNSSASGLRALPDYAAYTATKHALIGLTKTLALEFGPDGIRAVAICPGDIVTDMADLGMVLAARKSRIDPSEQESLAPLETIALRRRGRADEVARVVAWLASDDASYVSGNALLIDGALTEGM